jgi:tetratricopeptide (TPR) repeat protein
MKTVNRILLCVAALMIGGCENFQKMSDSNTHFHPKSEGGNYLKTASTGTTSSKYSSKSKLDEFDQANKFYEAGRLSEAEWLYKQVLKTAPDLDEAWLRLGNIYVRTNQLEAAAIHLDKCTTINPSNYRCWNNLALIRIKQAISTLDQAEKSFPKAAQEKAKLLALRKKLINLMSSK